MTATNVTAIDQDGAFHQLLREQVRNEFTASQQYVAVAVYLDDADVREPVALALAQEKTVTAQITRLARCARDSGDYLGEQFVQWFLEEQVEEVASMTTLLTVVDRAADNLFHVEDFVAREMAPGAGVDTTAPKAAGGAV